MLTSCPLSKANVPLPNGFMSGWFEAHGEKSWGSKWLHDAPVDLVMLQKEGAKAPISGIRTTCTPTRMSQEVRING